MGKARAIRLTGFVGALCVSAVLVGASVTGTGAWFTDSKAGSIAGSSGHLTLNIDPATSTNLSYANLMPGTNVDKTIHYGVDVSGGGVDVWLVFDKNTAAYEQFTGAADSQLYPTGGLGRYGYFAVSDSNGGQAFVTGNLSFVSDGTNSTNTCPTDANGRGGSPTIATTPTSSVPKCGVPAQILLASNLPTTQEGTVTVTYGLNGALQTQQNQYEGTIPFNLVATQTGHRP